jgi:hypothetical protein
LDFLAFLGAGIQATLPGVKNRFEPRKTQILCFYVPVSLSIIDAQHQPTIRNVVEVVEMVQVGIMGYRHSGTQSLVFSQMVKTTFCIPHD